MFAWRCLVIYMWRNLKRDSEFVTKSAVNEAHEYNGDKKLKWKDVRPTKHVILEGIAKRHNVNILLHKWKKYSV